MGIRAGNEVKQLRRNDMIDCHTHIVKWRFDKEEELTEEKLLKKMDELGIEKFVILPIGASPETSCSYFGTEDVLEVYRRHPDRVIPFCNLDPRNGYNSPQTDFSIVLNEYRDNGCRGLGELTANLYFDDPLCVNLFHHCGKAGLPIIFHLYNKFGGSYGLVDDIKLPRLEKVLKECPETIFIGHAMAFWAEISADVKEETRGGYPAGEIRSEGKLQELLRNYQNLYGDLSAGSGYNAITRDMGYGYKFLEKFQDQLLFGTDICHVVQESPIVDYFRNGLKEGKILKIAYNKITEENAKRVFKL
jgi:hypothetical protein